MPIPLQTLMSRPNLGSLRILKLKDRSNESLFRTLILSAILANRDDPSGISNHLRELIEKVVVSTEAPLLEYLRMITLIPAESCPTIQTSSNPYLAENIQREQSDIVDRKINTAISKLTNYLKKHQQSPPSRLNLPRVPGSTWTSGQLLEQHLFDPIILA